MAIWFWKNSTEWKQAFIPDRHYPFVAFDHRGWRMLRVAWQRLPLSGEGARLRGGRWNRSGTEALYLALDHATAIAEFHRRIVIPGTLVSYVVSSPNIADLTDGQGSPADQDVERATTEFWSSIASIDGNIPMGWQLADRLVAAGAHGALVPSAQNRGGTNLVLWRWSGNSSAGAYVRLIDPDGDLDSLS